MLHGWKFSGQVRGYALCGGIGLDQIGMSRFQVDQFAHECVISPVGNHGIIEYGVSIIVFVELFNELCNAVDGVHELIHHFFVCPGL